MNFFLLQLGITLLSVSSLILFFQSAKKQKSLRGFRSLAVGNTLVLLNLLLIVFLLGEIRYRFFYDETDFFGHSLSTRRWYKRYFQFNNVGVRDNIEYTPTLNPKKHRITFLGDSITAGTGVKDVNQCFVNLIRNKKKDEWDVHSLANVGYDTGDQILYLEDIVRHGYQIQTVVLIYFVNDLDDLIPEWMDYLSLFKKRIKRQNFFLKNSYMFNTLYYRWVTGQDPMMSRYFELLQKAYKGKAWEIQKKRLLRLKNFCEKNYGELNVILFPALDSKGPIPSLTDIDDQLTGFFQEEKIFTGSLRNIFQQADKNLTVSSFDSHPNSFAHEITAQYIKKFIEERL